MDVQKLKCFVVVAEKLSFTKAAAELYFSVPTVTHHIKGLEDEMGVKLFTRDQSSVRITAAGKTFYPVARDILMKLDEVVYKINKEKDFEILRIGCTSHAEMAMLISVFTEFRLKYPNILPNVEIGNFDNMLDMFEQNQLDLVFVTDNMLLRRKKNYDFHIFCRKDGFAVVQKGHRIAGLPKIHFSELEDETVLAMGYSYVPFNTGNPVTRLIQLHELHSKDVRCDDDVMLLSLAGAGYGAAILPGYCIPEYSEEIGLAAVPIIENQKLVYGVATHREKLKESTEYFISVAEKKVKSDKTSMKESSL